METYAKQSKPSARTLSARAGHGQPDVATVLQAYRNRTAQLAALTEDDEQALQGKFTTQLQEEEDEALQGKFTTQLQGEEEEEPLQGTFIVQKQEDEDELLQGKFQPVQCQFENLTGMPDQVKQQMEDSFGADFSDVRIHPDSDQAPKVGALAYTQGTDIHFAPGQLKLDTTSGKQLLGHELTHVIQQAEGRVQPTTEIGGMAVNDNVALENEADVLGAKAAR